MSFSINNAALSDSASFAQTVFENYYPGGKSPVKNTSASLAPPVLGRTLSTTTISSIINGDVFNRDPKYGLVATKNLVQSSTNSILSNISHSAAMAGDAIIVTSNPESQGEGDYSLTGSAAVNRIIANTVLGKNLGASYVDQALADIQQVEVENYNGEYGESPTSGVTNPSYEMQSAGRRDVTFIADLSAEEKGWYIERLDLLRSKYESLIGDHSYIGGFIFDIPNEWVQQGITVGNGEQTYFPDARVSDAERILPDELILQTPSGANAYLCAALIELLLLLHEKNYYISGDFSAGRDPRGYLDEGATSTWLNDHTFGRAVDIKHIGRQNGNVIDLWSVPPKETYDQGVQILLEALSEVPQYLLPDLIVVSSDLSSDYGVAAGNESMTAPIKLNRPHLEYVNFSADGSHKNHIHLSFSGMRAGKYVGPGGAMVIEGTSLDQDTGGTAVPGGREPTPEERRAIEDSIGTRLPVNNQGYWKSYYGDWNGRLPRQQIFDMLRTTGFSDEASAIFAAITGRESGGRIGACNPNAITGDFMSIGMFQINMGVGNYRKKSSGIVERKPKSGAAHGGKLYELTANNQKEQLQGWQIATKNWSKVYPNEPAPTRDNFNETISLKYEEERSIYGWDKPGYNATVLKMVELVDHRWWIPYNQAWGLYTFFTGQPPMYGAPKKGATPADGYLFKHWGDYSGKGPYGWIAEVEFAWAAEVYITTGKTKQNLIDWVKQVYQEDPSSYHKEAYSRQYIDRWLQGEVFK